jgi:hypothetical protein
MPATELIVTQVTQTKYGSEVATCEGKTFGGDDVSLNATLEVTQWGGHHHLKMGDVVKVEWKRAIERNQSHD